MIRVVVALMLGAAATVAHGDDMPHRKPGLWLIVSQPAEPGRKPHTNRLCIDRETESLLERMGAGTLQQACKNVEIHTAGSRVTIHSSCADATVTFKGDTRYSTDIHAGAMHMVQEGTWQGACPAGMSPGDMVMTDSRGREMHMNMRGLLRAAQ